MNRVPEQTTPVSNSPGSGTVRTITGVAAVAGMFATLIALLSGVAWQSFAPGWYAPVWVAGLGILAVVVFIVFNFEWLGLVISGRAAMSGLLVGLMCSAAVAIWIGGNFFFNYRGRWGRVRLSWSADLTKSGRFSLDEKTTAQLAELKEALEIFVVWRGVPGEDAQVDDMLERYADYSDKVKLEFLVYGQDFERKRKLLADRLKMHPDNISGRDIALFYGDKFKLLKYDDLWETKYTPSPYGMPSQERFCKAEEAVTSAIYEMLDPEKTKVYFVIDHGEKSPKENTQPGMTLAAELLRRKNIETETLDLRTVKEIPADASVVALCGPTRAVTPGEVEVLAAYLEDRQGRLLICLDEFNPAVDIGLDPLLERVGISANRDWVIEPSSDYSVGRGLPLLMGKDLGSEPKAVIETLARGNMRPVFVNARSLSRIEENQGPFKAFELCSGSSSSYGETELSEYIESGRTEMNAGRDTEGPVHYAMVAWEGPPPMFGMQQQLPKLGRVAVFGDSDWCSNMILLNPMVPGCQDNRTLFTGIVSWLAGKERRITIEPKKDEEQNYSMPEKHLVIAKVVLWMVPLGLLVLSAVVFWVRRR